MSTAGRIIGGVLRFVVAVIRFLVVLANRERMAAFVIFVLAVVLVLFFKLMLTRSATGWRRVRSIRFRLWLWLRPGRGFASLPELWLRWGRLAAVSYGARSRPGLSLRARLTLPTTDYAVRLGRAQYLRRLYAAFELHLLILAPPRTDKTGMLADRIIRHPGPVLTTSTRADLHDLTSGLRSDLGPVHVFNPEGVGDVPSTFAWDLLGVCTDELMAYKMADWLAGATDGYGDLAWFEEQGTMAMSGLLLAASMSGSPVTEVYRWASRRGHERALAALAEHGNPELHAVVRALMEDNNKTAASIRSTIARALKWAVIPQLAAAVDRRGTFNAREFALEGGTLHLIASGDSRSVITPLLRALASYVHYEAGLAGSKTGAGRLDPPLLMAMDEVAQVCLAAGTLVLTREGYIPIEAVSVGDRVLTHAGRWRRVLGKTFNGSRPVVRVRAQGVADLRATPDHQLWIRRGSGKHAKEQALRASPVWAPAASTLGSYVNLPVPPVEENPLSEEDWWIIGRWLGDGHRSIGQHGDTAFLVSCSHQELPGLLVRLGSRAGYVRRLRTASVVQLRSDEDGWLKAVLKGCGSGAANKKVPAIGLALCPEKAEALLSGYLSADGYYLADEDSWRASSVSRALLLGMAMVVQRARGAVASVYAGRPARKHVIEGRVVQARQEWTLCFSGGSHKPRPQGGHSRSGWIDASCGAWKKVRAIQEIDAAEVWDLRVEGDESFVAEGCVVHNCPVDLPSMLADSAGKGITFVTVGHSLAKLEERYGEDGAANIWAISGVKMLLRGITEPRTLEDVSRVCGTLGDEDDDRVRIVPPDVLRRLPKHSALVINMDLSPAVVRVSRAWKRRSVRRIAGQAPALPAPREIPAEELAARPAAEPVLTSANGHGGRPGPLARTEP
jgi:hypothetical protein